MRNAILALLPALLFCASESAAAPRYSLLGGVTYNGLNGSSGGTSASVSYEMSGSVGIAAGVIAAWRLSPNVSFEAGLMYLSMAYRYIDANYNLGFNSNYLNSTGGLKLGLSSRFSLTLGMFYGLCLTCPGLPSAYGASLGLRLSVARGVFFEPRLNYDLKSQVRPLKDLVGLVGFEL
jgi:hypothetical protein